MGTGYTRQSSAEIVDGQISDASDFNNEFNQLQSAFDGTTGHSHDGTSGEGPIITVPGGGTGVATLTDGGVLLGSGTGAVTATAVLADGEMLVGDGTTDPALESGATLRTSVGVGTGDSPQFTGIELGHATDTTIVRSGAGDITIEGNAIYRAGGTDVPVADGGTGASTLTDGGVLLGSGTGAITAMAVLADGEIIVGDGTTDPVAESGATARTSLGVAIGSDVQAFGAVLDDINSLGVNSADSEFMVGTGAGALAWESGATARTSMGVGTGDSPAFAGLDVNGGELVLDADGDTSITADTDDQIDFRIAGADDFQMTANTLSVLSGSTLNIDSGATIANSGTATGFGLGTSGPAWLAYNSASDNNVTGNGTEATIEFDAEIFDQAGDFNTTTDTVTISVAGRYYLEAQCQLTAATNASVVQLKIITSNRIYAHHYRFDPGGGSVFDIGFSVLADMDVSDTATVTITVGGVGADTTSVIGSSPRETRFSGFLATG